MPLDAHQQLELGFTIALTLFAVAALVSLRPERVDAALIIGLVAIQLVYPTAFIQLASAFVFLVFAIDLLVDRRRAVRSLLGALRGELVRPAPYRQRPMPPVDRLRLLRLRRRVAEVARAVPGLRRVEHARGGGSRGAAQAKASARGARAVQAPAAAPTSRRVRYARLETGHRRARPRARRRARARERSC